MAFKKATACWFSILCFALISESLAEPETVDGLMKKNQNAWNVPIVAHQPNENKPTKVIGGYPGFKPDTLARPLKSQKGRVPFGQYLHDVSSVIPDSILKWMSQRQRLMTTLKPIHEENNMIPNTAPTVPSSPASGSSKEPTLIMTSMSSLIEKPTSKPNLEETLASGDKRKVEVMDDIEKKSADIESSTSNTEKTITKEEENFTISPRVAAVILDDYIARREDKISIAGLVIGLTFVAAFLSIAIGLLGHGMIKKYRKPESGRSSRNSWMRSPGDDDRTPPELRPGSNSGHPTYSDSSRRNSSRTRHLPGTLPGHTGTPFFNGKLILHDPPGLANGARGVARPFNPGNVLASSNPNAGFLMTSPPSKLGAIPKKMPSPAALVTDILVSPKYDDDETTEEEEDSDDTVYECPGLAATHRGGMEVRNPFFMEGDLQPASGMANKKPISQYTDLFHHQEIAGFN